MQSIHIKLGEEEAALLEELKESRLASTVVRKLLRTYSSFKASSDENKNKALTYLLRGQLSLKVKDAN